jgi:hypothetical protein
VPVANPSSFRSEAKWQRACALCGRGGSFQAHHVVDKATLKTRCHLAGEALYDTRNALRLCEGLDTNRCHMQFENRRVEITTAMLTDDNIDYAFEALGIYAYDYLRREYNDTACDPRIQREFEARLDAP